MPILTVAVGQKNVDVPRPVVFLRPIDGMMDDIDTPPDELLHRAVAISHARIPVYRGSIEQPIGVVTVRDLLRAAVEGKTLRLADLIHPAFFVPKSTRVSRLLRDFQRRREYLALAVDECGGIAGLVTIQDVLEEIVGEISEPDEPTPEWVTPLHDGRYAVDGNAPVRELRETLGLPVPDSPDYTTAAGFVISVLGSIPSRGASLLHRGWRWTVVDVEGPRVTKLMVERPGA